MSIHWADHPTAESIAAAKIAQQQERAAVEKATGVRITESGKVIVGVCRTCGFIASAKTQGRVTRALSAHIIGAHARKEQA